MGALRERLRAQTRAAHERVDAAFSRFDLSRREGYGGFLRAHAAVLPGLEAAVEAGGAHAILPDWPERRRAEALAQDLRRLRIEPPLGGAAPALTAAAALGALYVLEGSRLGARLILAEARRSADPLVRGTTAYLAHGEGRRFWPTFLQALERQGAAEEAVVAGALAGFSLFEEAAGLHERDRNIAVGRASLG